MIVITPTGAAASFDAIDPRDPTTLIEVKTGYGRVFGDPVFRAETIANWITQSQDQLLVAEACGFEVAWVFNDADVAAWAQPLIGEAEARYARFPCRSERLDD